MGVLLFMLSVTEEDPDSEKFIIWDSQAVLVLLYSSVEPANYSITLLPFA